MRPASYDAIAASIVSRTSLGFGPFADAFDHVLRDRPDLVPARVTRVDRGQYRLAGAVAGVGELTGRLRHDLAGIDLPTVGDWVAIRDVDDGAAVALVHHVLPRRTALIRRAAGLTGAAQVVAANVDVCFVVTSANRDANPRRLERYLTAVWDSGASPVVVLNKIDLGGDVAALVAALAAVAPGVPIEAVSAVTGDGVAPLRAHLAAGPGGAVRTVGLVGSSGVGKSSLVNRLLGVDRQATAGLDDDERGRHTTTRRELVVLPGGGVLIDTPGMRELGLVEDAGGVDTSFADLAALADACRFRDCLHDGEPGCAVADAVRRGALDPARLRAFHRLQRELAASERRRDPALADRAKRRWKSTHMAMRARMKVDPKLRR